MPRKVNVTGVGMVPFAKPGKSEEYHVMAKQASEAARDARIAQLEAELATRVTERDEAHANIAQLNERYQQLSSELQERTNERDSHSLTLQERDARIAQLEADLAERTAQRDQEMWAALQG